jgi:hypothetical protein
LSSRHDYPTDAAALGTDMPHTGAGDDLAAALQRQDHNSSGESILNDVAAVRDVATDRELLPERKVASDRDRRIPITWGSLRVTRRSSVMVR